MKYSFLLRDVFCFFDITIFLHKVSIFPQANVQLENKTKENTQSCFQVEIYQQSLPIQKTERHVRISHLTEDFQTEIALRMIIRSRILHAFFLVFCINGTT